MNKTDLDFARRCLPGCLAAIQTYRRKIKIANYNGDNHAAEHAKAMLGELGKIKKSFDKDQTTMLIK